MWATYLRVKGKKSFPFMSVTHRPLIIAISISVNVHTTKIGQYV